MSEGAPVASGPPRTLRIVVFGVTGQVGQELVDRLDDGDWPIAELVGVASGDSHGASFVRTGNDASTLGTIGNAHRASSPARIIMLFNRGKKGVHIDKDNYA